MYSNYVLVWKKVLGFAGAGAADANNNKQKTNKQTDCLSDLLMMPPTFLLCLLSLLKHAVCLSSAAVEPGDQYSRNVVWTLF
jgi:hypothetical protein